MRLADDVWLVGGGAAAFDLSSPYDSHVYVVGHPPDLALIDCGIGMGEDAIVAEMQRDGLALEDVHHLFVTHYHADHAGGAASWKRRTGARLYASAETAAALRNADAEKVGLVKAKASGVYPSDYVLERAAVDVEVADRRHYEVGGLVITSYLTPGHCDGHTAYLLAAASRSYLFTGDCVFWGGRIGLQNLPDCDIAAYSRSIELLAELEFDALLPGHLTISLKNGKRHVDTAARAFRSLSIPPNVG